MDVSILSTLVQAVGTLLIAGILRELTQALPGRFLVYWWRAWACLSVALFCLLVSIRIDSLWESGHPAGRVFLAAYCALEYGFGFFLWLGCREYSTGRQARGKDARILIVPMIVAGILPVIFPTIELLFPAHAAMMTAFYLIAMVASYRRTSGTVISVGIKLIRYSLLGLTLLFLHYAVVIGFIEYKPLPGDWSYLSFSSVYDALIEIGLAFGMVLVASDRVRSELEERNRKLAQIREELEIQNRKLATQGDELALVARTDPLTGLLNRRALDELTRNDRISHGNGALAVIDLNDLKPLNDLHGHQVGDIALQIVARALRIHFRVTDPLFRLGGDEFLVIMDGCPGEDLAGRLAGVDRSLLSQRIPGIDEPIDLVVSWGIAEFSATESYAKSIQSADERMYAQKKKRKSGSRGSIILPV